MSYSKLREPSQQDRRLVKMVEMLRPLAVAVIGLSLAGCQPDAEPVRQAADILSASEQPDAEAALRAASRAAEAARYSEAQERLRPLLLAQPDHPQALFLAARCQAGLGNLAEAVETLAAIPGDHPEAGLAALGQAADWLIQIGQYREAEKRLERILAIHGDVAMAHRRLARIRNNQGRRIEAAPHLRALARLGDVTEAELYGLSTFSDPFVHRPRQGDATAVAIEPSRLTEAKILWYEGDLRKARLLADEVRAEMPDSAAAAAFCGRIYADLNDDSAFLDWISELPRDIERQPEYWYALGTWHQHQNEHEVATRCFLEAVQRDDTDRYSYLALARSLKVSGHTAAAERVLRRHELLEEAAYVVTEPTRTADQLRRLSQILDQLHRPWEARAWRKLAGATSRAASDDASATADRSAQRPEKWATCGLAPEDFPLPDVSQVAGEVVDKNRSSPTAGQLVLRDVASRVGLEFQYQPNSEGRVEDLLMHETVGGGIAAADYDLDGWTDLYFTQGGGPALSPDGSQPNQLFRNLAGKAFRNVSPSTHTGDRGYGHGAAAADINQDGFADLLVANFGPNVLYLNNGDGTFTRRALGGAADDSPLWTTTIACGDLSGDSLPDVVEINYIDDASVLPAVCSGETSVPLCNPQRYRAALDRFLKNRGDGVMESWEAAESPSPPGYGFAAIIANFDREAGNDLFVANDTSVNHYWVSRSGEDSSGDHSLSERAQLFGCARGVQGVAQSCMGVAAGDFDRNGWIDLHISNYTDESSDLFMQQPSGIFVNQSVLYGLDVATRSQMGWGTQAADFNCDGWLDMAVLNGNLYHQPRNAAPYRMPPQLFRGGPGRFELVEPESAGNEPESAGNEPESAGNGSENSAKSYWSVPTLGRTLARLDWNRDGHADLVANHLDVPVALLENDSPSGNWLQLELVGTESERDAVGAEVVVHCGQQRWTRWVTGGDGYLCRNEPVLSVGLGDAQTISKVEVRWPSGAIDVHRDFAANQRYLIIENAPAIVSRSQ